MAESEKAAKYLQDAGYDMLNCDNGTYDAWYWAHPLSICRRTAIWRMWRISVNSWISLWYAPDVWIRRRLRLLLQTEESMVPDSPDSSWQTRNG